ncbi:MAG: ABC transporter permease [Bacteroidota bacterium]
MQAQSLYSQLNNQHMLFNFLSLSVRSLKKNGLYSIINISGLTIGIICSVLILLWVEDEVSYDKFLPKYDRLFQVWISSDYDNKVNNWESVPLPTYEFMKTVDSNVKNSTVVGWGNPRLLAAGDVRIIKHGYYVSEEFLEMFEFPLLKGSHSEALKDPLSIVISESLATILFGDEDPIGKQVKLADEGLLQVTAVLKDLPKNSTFQFDYLATWKYRESQNKWIRENKTNWGNYSYQVFVELNEASRQAAVDQSIFPVMMEKDAEDGIEKHLFLYPMKKWRLYSNWDAQGNEIGGRSDYVQLFTFIAVVILVIACINFMNLATARSEKRAKEVGIRKSLGSSKKRLIAQFISESIFTTTIAFVAALILTQALLPAYNDLVEKQLSINYSDPLFWIYSVCGIIILGIVSGSYPAFYLSSFNPIKTLKGTLKMGKGGTLPRKILVVLQFSFSIILIISTIIIFRQIELVKDRDLGYDQENLLSMDYTHDISENYDVIKQELLASGVVESMTRSNSKITQINSNNFLGWPGKPENQKVIFTTITSDYDYAETMGIEMLLGRDFSADFASDSNAIIVNKAALELMNLEDPIGTNLSLWGEPRKLVGVMDNVLMGSIYEPVKPLFMVLQNWGGYVTIRLKKEQDLTEALGILEKIFNKYNPAYPFDYKFMDTDFQQKFNTIYLTQKLATLFSALAIMITGLGLFGLAAFTAEQRTKEIGIRKVLGATVANLVKLMSSDFAKLVIISFVLAAPAGWYLMDKYLDRYTIRISIEWWIFPVVGLLVLGFATLIVSAQAQRAAKANPVNSLRSE